MAGEEIELTGGNTSPGVVRVGQTVRRRLSKSSPTIHRLLLHLECAGYPYSPRFLGIDRQGREILEYVEGRTGFTEEMWRFDRPLLATARLLRGLHDATQSFPRADDDVWAMRHPDPACHEVICHHDFAPYNLVFDAGVPAAVIDFDPAGPGPRLWDVAYAAYWLTPLAFGAPDLKPRALADLQAGSGRLRRFCAAYGIAADQALLNMAGRVLDHMADPKAAARAVGQKAAQSLEQGGHFEHWRRESAAFREYAPALRAQLA